MDGALSASPPTYTTSAIATAAGYSVQQVRDLERLGVIPAATRQANGYRRFDGSHVIALRAYRNLALAVGPVVARDTMRQARELPYDDAIARIVALHVDLALSRERTVEALLALDSIVANTLDDAASTPADSMRITELAAALGVRPSALRFWEQQGLVTPERPSGSAARNYLGTAIRDARIVAALRAGGYRIPDIRSVMQSLRSIDNTGDVHGALQHRLRMLATRSAALLRAGTDIADLLSRRLPSADGAAADSPRPDDG